MRCNPEGARGIMYGDCPNDATVTMYVPELHGIYFDYDRDTYWYWGVPVEGRESHWQWSDGRFNLCDHHCDLMSGMFPGTAEVIACLGPGQGTAQPPQPKLVTYVQYHDGWKLWEGV